MMPCCLNSSCSPLCSHHSLPHYGVILLRHQQHCGSATQQCSSTRLQEQQQQCGVARHQEVLLATQTHMQHEHPRYAASSSHCVASERHYSSQCNANSTLNHRSIHCSQHHRSKKNYLMLLLSSTSTVFMVLIICMLLTVLLDSVVLASAAVNKQSSCNRTRVVLEDTWGTFSDGEDVYMPASHCQWLIKAPSSSHFITLQFSFLDTECSYDHVYVYDGATFDSKLLGVFSGNNKPKPVTASSGFMLVLLYSDTNYALKGFEAAYSITDCPKNCSSHGNCVNHACECDLGYVGLSCEQALCPDGCNSDSNKGRCFQPPQTIADRDPQMFCLCNPGYFGDRCSLTQGHSSSSGFSDAWRWLWGPSEVHSISFSPRTSHGTVYIPELDKMYIFGGYDLNTILGDLIVFNVKNGTWLTVGNETSTKAFHNKLFSRRLASIVPLVPTEFEKDPSSDVLFPPEQYPPNFPEKSRDASKLSSASSAAPFTLLGQHKEFFQNSRMHPSIQDISNIQTQSKHQNKTLNLHSTLEESLIDQAWKELANFEGFEDKYGDDRKWKRSASNSGWQRRASHSYKRELRKNKHSRLKRMVPPGSESSNSNRFLSELNPGPRFGHAMAAFGQHFVMYGGKLETGVVSSEFWMYNTITEQWSLLTNSSIGYNSSLHHQHLPVASPDGESVIQPPGLMYTTLTLVGTDEFYLFGGNLPYGAFSNLMFRINMTEALNGNAQWRVVPFRGGNSLRVRLVGHSTVYHAQSHSLLVYGGIRVDIARFSKLSDRLLKFDLRFGYWSTILYQDSSSSRQGTKVSNVPLERAFHTAFIAGDYMVVFGGYLHKHKKEETCYDHNLYLYHLKCHTWQTRAFFTSIEDPVHGLPGGRGVYGHGAFLLDGRTMVVVGGFHGTVSNGVMAYTLPMPFLPDDSVSCAQYSSQAVCVSGTSGIDKSDCGWCGANDHCYPHSSTSSCTTNLQTASCPGICPLLTTCTACTLSACTWCPYTRECHAFDASSCPSPSKDGDRMLKDIVGSMAGVSRPADCGFTASQGLTFTLFRPPVDLTRPDVVRINNGTLLEHTMDPREEFRGAREALGDKKEDRGVEVGRLKGFILPPLDPPDLRLKLRAEWLNASLTVDGERKQSIIVSEDKTTTVTGEDVKFTGPPGSAYLIEVEGRATGSLNLMWSGQDGDMQVTLGQVRTFRSGLSNADCPSRRTCLACVADNACGWCPVGKGFCLLNNVPCSRPNGTSEKDQYHRVLVPSECSLCQQHIYCHTCAHDPECEWLPDPAHCTRRGRFPSIAVADVTQCPPECHERKSCSSCLGTSGRCAWCQHTQECFLFSVYTSVYQYGACRVWLDEDHTNVSLLETNATARDGGGALHTSSSWRHHSSASHSVPLSNILDTSFRSSNSQLPSTPNNCLMCSRHLTCTECLQSLECGWCYNSLNPSIGRCVEGDFYAPHYGTCESQVNPILDHFANLSLQQEDTSGVISSVSTTPLPVFDPNVRTALYAHSSCPDLDECHLKLHECHQLATCTNTDGGYNCTCNRGYMGDGRNICERTCNVTCVHGRCSNAPEYKCICKLGWTGLDCSIDCGCHNHSTCLDGIGKCDACQENTHGEHCQLCKENTWGSAVSPAGCQECSCNGHGDPSLGTCHQQSGQCYCSHNTKGRHCEFCLDGFYGNPAKGGKCYRRCEPRNIIYGATSGNLGAQRSPPPQQQQHISGAQIPAAMNADAFISPSTRHLSVDSNGTETCLWVVTPHKTIEPPTSSSTGTHVILFTLETLHVPCFTSSLLIYDGVPEVLSTDPRWDRRNHVLAAYCEEYSSTGLPSVVEAKSGYLTLLLQRRGSTEGFSGSYEVLSCPDRPGPNRLCVDKKPVCVPRGAGGLCQQTICPSNCHAAAGHGVCDEDYGRCLCNDLYVGQDCGTLKQRHMVLLQELFDAHKIDSSAQQHLLMVLPRYGHSMVADQRGVLWLFGGQSLSRGPLNDVMQFDTRNNSWVPVTVSVQPDIEPPLNRYFHASTYVPSRRAMFVYGGLSESRYLSDLWSFNIDVESWTLLDKPHQLPRWSKETHGNLKEGSSIAGTRVSFGEEEVLQSIVGAGQDSDGSMTYMVPPPVAGHTLTYCNDGHVEKEILLLIGGISDWQGFLDKVWEYRISSGVWHVVNTTGTSPLGIFGHSTVYHAEDKIFYVYGGYTFNVDRVGLFGELYALHYPSRSWSLLPLDTKINENTASIPAPRAFHTAVTTSNYLMIIGGHIEEQRDWQQSLMVYSYKCNMWFPLNEHFITLAGPKVQSLVGVASAIHGQTVYVYGGYDGITRGAMTSIVVPEDLCTLRANKTQCRDLIGCANCVVYGPTTNTSYCFSNANPQPSVCYGESGSSYQGRVCNASLIQSNCYQYKTCGACLATYPSVTGSEQKCKWCRNCIKYKCIPKQNDCATDNVCEAGTSMNGNADVLDSDKCYSKRCAATDCARCEKLGQCMWSRHVMTSPLTVTPNITLVFHWSCVDKGILNHSAFDIKSSLGICPEHCLSYRSCNKCLGYTEGGGMQQCYWSQALSTCLAPSYVPLRCLGGRCGVLIHSRPCPMECEEHKTCSECLQHPQCGWCGLDTKVGGLGLCTNGGLPGPSEGSCSELDYTLLLEDNNIRDLHDLTSVESVPASAWHYEKCPPEDECLSGHHTCHPKSQDCVDKQEGYSCICAAGYNTSDDGECIPLCQQGCVHGTCVEPNNCSCNFGYVGSNCSIKCHCNEHSDCRGPDKLSECIKCHNNTTGPQCEKCMPQFVGDPKNGGTCKSCFDYCNTHSDKCFPTSDSSDSAMKGHMSSNIAIADAAVCQSCSNNTTGNLCDQCIQGHFRGSLNLKTPCIPCQCNGHSDVCDPVWGDNCKCSNNTESPCSSKESRKDDDKDCQKKQCTKCKDSYLGSPSNGHQCYYQMSVEKEYCLDPVNQHRCDLAPNPLHYGQSVFFAVQPKFMNVNIRLVLDITRGAVRVFLSSIEDMFLVDMNTKGDPPWKHKVKLDPRYSRVVTEGTFVHDTKEHRSKHFTSFNVVSASKKVNKQQCNSASCSKKSRQKRSFSGPVYRIIERDGNGLKTFVTVQEPYDVLVVNNITNRLVITLPQSNHDLRSAKFYIIIVGVEEEPSGSEGTVYFRQDQPRIDLFVFFSVFFSCFFLFLAVCVVVWKVKQNIDHRRARRRHVVEMLHMARRPFAVTTLVIQDGEDASSTPLMKGAVGTCYSPTSSPAITGTDTGVLDVAPIDPPPWSPGRRKRPTLNKKSESSRAVSGVGGVQQFHSSDAFDVGPVAVEPTDDGVAAVATVVIQFPGFDDFDDGRPDTQGPSHRLALGSSLCLMSRIYPPPPSKTFQIRR